MKIIHITPSSGNSFYCQNCLRDISLIKALRSLGHDVIIVPMYLPLFADYPNITGDSPLFYGAVLVYLEQISPLFRRMPNWMERIFNSPKLLNWVAKKAGSTRAKGLENMTLSMLQGEYGHQARELNKLVSWLESEAKPDIIHISNALLLGLVRRIKMRLHVPIVCTLQDEDSWIDSMDKKYIGRIWDLISERAQDVDKFIAVSQYYANLMQTRMRIPFDKIEVVYNGIDLEGYQSSSPSFDPPVIGYLSRITESLGFGILIDAFIKLKNDKGFQSLKLKAAGGYGEDDRKFITKLQKRLASFNILDDVAINSNIDRESRLKFLHSLSLLSVPVPNGEAFGFYQIEAIAAGVPVVQPKAGAFTEIIEATKGGIVYEPNNADTLASALASLLHDPKKACKIGQVGRKNILKKFTINQMADNIINIYQDCLKI